MHLDIFTILFLIASIAFLAALGFGASWLRLSSEPVLGATACTFVVMSLGVYLHAAEAHIPQFYVVEISNSLIFASIALGWNAFRLIYYRKFLVIPVVLPGFLWMLLCGVPAFYANVAWHVVVASCFMSLLFFGCFYEVRRSSIEYSGIRTLLLISAGSNATIFAVRGIYALVVGHPESLLDGDQWMALSLSLPLIFATAFVFGGLWLWQARTVGVLQREVEIDPLTGALNRRAFESGGYEMLHFAGRQQTSMSLLLFDIDHFKLINDRVGHLAGDHVLRELASMVAKEVRKSDLFARYGGEEFVLMLNGAHLGDAVIVAEKLRAMISATPIFWEGKSIRVTVSIGVAATQGDYHSLLDLIDQADNGLYCAKRAGRNRIATAPRLQKTLSFERLSSLAD